MKLEYSAYFDKVLACWTGKSIGGIIGAPFECHHRFKEHTGELWPKKLWPNDDLDIQVVYVEALQERGVFIDSDYLADYWHKHCFYTCCEYGVLIDNLEHGLRPPLTGKWDNRFYEEGMGCPIRSEIWGLLCPGNPQLAAEYAAMDGCLDHTAFSVEAEQFLSAADSLAFFSSDLYAVLDEALQVLPAQSDVREMYAFVKDLCRREASPKKVWQAIIRRWGHRNATLARSNFPLILAALFLGKDDFRETMRLCIQFGWDADCTAATAGALLGILHGTAVLPQDWRDKMGKTLVCACEIPHQFATLEQFAKDTCLLGVEMTALRNDTVELVGAPEVILRRKPAATVAISAEYDGEPVLRKYADSHITLKITNPFDKTLKCRLSISGTSETSVAAPASVTLPPKGTAKAAVTVSWTAGDDAWMPDKNFFNASLDVPGNPSVEFTFGLFGAREFRLYGPYWDMFDDSKYAVCPYDNDDVACNPANIPGCRDAMDTYVSLDREYLDEAALLKHDLPDENPVLLEKGGREFLKKDFGGFTGTCCYYLTLNIRSAKELEQTIFGFSSATPAKAWIDGRLIYSQDKELCPIAVFGDDMLFNLTAKPQRVVIKIATHSEEPFCELFFFKPSQDATKAISPYVADIATL